ncbi:hypothetical protein TNCV_1986451 [Trichonephila clavipes]|nr:hypothetical protein TNCV_1986451 [Trichonephila clavipes]
MFTQCGEQPGCIWLASITMEATFFFRETTVKSSPSVSVRSPMPSALTTRALARIGPATFVLLASELLSSAELSSSIAERVSSFTAAGGGVVLQDRFRSPARCFFPYVPGTGEVVERFCVPLFAFEREGIVGKLFLFKRFSG